MTPAAFAEGWRTAHLAAPASAEQPSAYGLGPSDAGGSLTLKEEINHQLSEQVAR
jgi:hypothetical protein